MDILAVLATIAIAVASVGFLLRIWVDKRLGQALGKELELFKAELSKDVARYSVQTTWNHTKMMDLFAQLYERMIDADFEIKALLANIKIGKADLIELRANRFCEKYLELNACLHKNELFISQELSDSVRAAYHPFFEVAQASLGETPDLSRLKSVLPSRIEDIFAVGDLPRKQIVQQFRKHSGLEV